jgi:hypothetical protein
VRRHVKAHRSASAAKATVLPVKRFTMGFGSENAVDLVGMILVYCLGARGLGARGLGARGLGARGLRCTAAWGSAPSGVGDISNVALLDRRRQCGDWLALLVGQTLTCNTPQAARCRLIRIIDATTAPKAGAVARTKNALRRIHSAFDLPSERFGFIELTDEKGGERRDRIAVVKGEIRSGDRAYLQASPSSRFPFSRRAESAQN